MGDPLHFDETKPDRITVLLKTGETVQLDQAHGVRWAPHMTAGMVKWRVEQRVVWVRYYKSTTSAT